eukprot:TRINITY_DN6071_c0_g1_i3.p2 TRINITY_DN6071_c0_g1~~TRINITY_DN6071_c0_g1_i3.p2  ORF type:complete len:120 (-),score=34.81 TRINITY_DN6071_c0_g1_i3:177-536(-)
MSVYNLDGSCLLLGIFFFFFKQKTAYEMLRSLVGSEMCIRDRCTNANVHGIEDVVRFACCGTVSVLGGSSNNSGSGSSGTPLSTVDLVEASEAGRRLEMLCSKPPPFGRTLLNLSLIHI